MLFPIIKAGGTFWQNKSLGKLNGIIAAITPSGALVVICIVFSFPASLDPTKLSPYKCFAFSTNPRTPILTFATSPLASVIGFPVSSDNNFAKRSLFSSTKSTNLYSISPLSYIETCAHFFCSSLATATASSTSSRLTFGTLSINSCVAGFTTSIFVLPVPSLQFLPIKTFMQFPSFFLEFFKTSVFIFESIDFSSFSKFVSFS